MMGDKTIPRQFRDKAFRIKIMEAFQKNNCHKSFSKEVIRIMWAENMITYNQDGEVIRNASYWADRKMQ